jgi:predicted porin
MILDPISFITNTWIDRLARIPPGPGFFADVVYFPIHNGIVMTSKIASAAILALSGFALPAFAQSSVTLYGIVDSGVLYNDNIKGLHEVALSQANSSRWGLKGNEDLGGGLAAIFNLESGFTSGTGALSQGGLEFGRRAYVGLSSPTWGSLTAGRQYPITDDMNGSFASGVTWAGSGISYGTRGADVDNLDTTNRIQNSVKYTSPDYRGLKAGLLYSFGGQAGHTSQNSVVDVAFSYTNGPVKVGAGYSMTKQPYYATYGDQGNSSTPSTAATGANDNMNNTVYGGYASANSQRIVVTGASYQAGPATVAVLYSNVQFQNLGSVNAIGAIAAPKYIGGSATFNSGEINLKYQLTPAVWVAGAYIYTHNTGADNVGSANYNHFNLGATYSISKQTSFYALAYYETAEGIDSTGKPAVADLVGSSYSSNRHQLAAIFGMTHQF